MSKESDEVPSEISATACLFLLALIFILGLCIGTIINSIHYNSQISELGDKMCAEHGLTLDHERIEYNPIKIYCKNETRLEDGYLLVSG